MYNKYSVLRWPLFPNKLPLGKLNDNGFPIMQCMHSTYRRVVGYMRSKSCILFNEIETRQPVSVASCWCWRHQPKKPLCDALMWFVVGVLLFSTYPVRKYKFSWDITSGKCSILEWLIFYLFLYIYHQNSVQGSVRVGQTRPGWSDLQAATMTLRHRHLGLAAVKKLWF